MFDYLKCEYPLPDDHMQDHLFQTKSLPAMFLDTYVITRAGRLVHQAYRMEEVPEEERPFYGKPEWDDGWLSRFAGSLRRIPLGDVDLEWHGDVRFYESADDGTWYEYRARFTDGQLESIQRVKAPWQE